MKSYIRKSRRKRIVQRWLNKGRKKRKIIGDDNKVGAKTLL